MRIPRQFFLIPLIMILVIAQSNVAPATVNNCVPIENDLDRLACYDNEAGRTPNVMEVQTETSAWQVVSAVSKLTDDPTVTLSVSTSEPVHCGFREPARASLYLRCMENTTSLFFATQCHLTSSKYNDYGHVDIRLDNDKAFTSRMNESTDNRALGLWSGGVSIPVIKKMFGKKRLIARMTPYSESPITMEMDITGLEIAIDPLREACGW